MEGNWVEGKGGRRKGGTEGIKGKTDGMREEGREGTREGVGCVGGRGREGESERRQLKEQSIGKRPAQKSVGY